MRFIASGRCISILALAGFIASATAQPFEALPPPTDRSTLLRIEVRLNTYAITPLVPTPEGTIPLLDLEGRVLGPRFEEGPFCDLAAQGSAVIDGATYRVVGTGRAPQAFCGRYYSRLHRKQPVAAGALSRSRFTRIDWPYGLGAKDYKLVPYRSAAAQPRRFPVGTTLFVPALRGLALPSGTAGTAHDGYLFVADLREGAHDGGVALFTGLRAAALSGSMQELFVVTDARVIDALRRLHRLN